MILKIISRDFCITYYTPDRFFIHETRLSKGEMFCEAGVDPNWEDGCVSGRDEFGSEIVEKNAEDPADGFNGVSRSTIILGPSRGASPTLS